MATVESSASTAQEERRIRCILEEAEERYRSELMDSDEERQLLLDRIKRLRKSLAL